MTQTIRTFRWAVLLICCCLCPPLFAMNARPAHALSISETSTAFSEAVKRAGPAVVHVRVEKSVKNTGMDPAELFSDPFFEHFFGRQFRSPGSPRQDRRGFKQQGAGSGFIIDRNGYILTNNHVVEGAEKIIVRLADKREFTGKVVGTDPQSDVALVRIEGKDLPVIALGDSDALEVGEWAIAIGSPFELSQTVTVGVVSAKGRNHVGITDYENFIQTDAAINPGNSGGPLLNIRGEAIGINTAIFSRSGGYMGIGFAIPINMAKGIEQQLRQGGKVTRGWLGVMIQDVNEELARSFGRTKSGGALVSEVAEGSPAARDGLKQGDIIIAINGSPVSDVADLRNRIAMTPPKSKVDLRILREGKESELAITIGEQPADGGKAALASSPDSTLSKMGLSLQNLTEDVAGQLGYSKGQGVLIAGVEDGSPAAQAGLQAGQLVEEVNRVRVRNLKELGQALKKSADGKSVLLRVRSGERSQYVALRSGE